MLESGTNGKHGGRMALGCLTGVGLVMLSAGVAVAQQHPDLSGYWELRYDSFNVPQASVIPGTIARAAAQIVLSLDLAEQFNETLSFSLSARKRVLAAGICGN